MEENEELLEQIKQIIPYKVGDTVYTTSFTKDEVNYRTFFSIEATIDSVTKLKFKDFKHNNRKNPRDIYKYRVYYQNSNKVKYGSELFDSKKAASWDARKKQEAFDGKYGEKFASRRAMDPIKN